MPGLFCCVEGTPKGLKRMDIEDLCQHLDNLASLEKKDMAERRLLLRNMTNLIAVGFTLVFLAVAITLGLYLTHWGVGG